MRIKMVRTITGTRNGAAWPKRNEEVDVPQAEALKLIKSNLAVPVAEKAKEERATIKQDDVETREDKESAKSDEKAEEEATDTEEETARPRRGRPPRQRED